MTRTAISPRLATKSLRSGPGMPTSGRLDEGQDLAGLQRSFIVGDEADDAAGDLGSDFAELLHHFHEADHVADRDRVACLLERCRVGGWPAVEGARQR